MTKNLEPRTLKGFYDYFAEDMLIRNFIRDTFREIAEKYSFEPLETPALEYSELILGQSGEEAEKLYYRFEDNGGRDVMLKYELMTSMCRAVGQNINEIPMPYKRYQMQNVWRAENVQKGRLREFTQLDIDTMGSSSPLADAEIIQFGLEFLKELGFKKYLVRINSRNIIQGLLEVFGIDNSKFEDVYIAIDKVKKIGVEGVKKELIEIKKIDEDNVDDLIRSFDINSITELEELLAKSKIGTEGIGEVRSVLSILKDSGISDDLVKFDITLARGLASYTGVVWEFEVIDGDVGSVSGGGRYDKAIGKYVNRDIPATGTSFGLERLMQVIKDRKMPVPLKGESEVLVIAMNDSCISFAMKVVKKLRGANINTGIYPDIQKLKVAFKFANRKNIPWVIVIGDEEVKKEAVQLKNMREQTQETLSISETIERLSKK